jgi:hypothetical protein
MRICLSNISGDPAVRFRNQGKTDIPASRK